MATNQLMRDAGDDERQSLHGQPGSSAELIAGLQLLRASTLASTRLQLALARQDRGQAVSELDALTDIDAELERLVSGLSVHGADNDDLAGIEEWLVAQKSAIAKEKFSLTCGVAGPDLVTPPDCLSIPEEASNASSVREEDGPLRDRHERTTYNPGSSGRAWLVIVFLTIAVLAIAVAALAEPGTDVLSMLSLTRR